MGAFRCSDGRELHSLKDMALSLDEMDDGVFMHHVNMEKNDFVPWVKEMGEEELAGLLSNMQDKRDMAYMIMKYLVQRM